LETKERRSSQESSAADMERETAAGAEVFTEAGAKAIAAEAVTSMSAADLNTFMLLIFLYN
jgi:hypothetical protein